MNLKNIQTIRDIKHFLVEHKHEILNKMMVVSGAKTDAELARAIGVTPQSVGAARSGSIPPIWLMYFYLVYGVPFYQLCITPLEKLQSGEVSVDKISYIMIKSYSSLDPSSWTLGNMSGVIPVYREILPDCEVDGIEIDDVAIVQNPSDSLKPDLKKGDLIILCKQASKVISGEIYLIKLDNDYLLVRLYKFPSGYQVDVGPEHSFQLEQVDIQARVVSFFRQI